MKPPSPHPTRQVKIGDTEYTVDHSLACHDAIHANGWHLYHYLDPVSNTTVRGVRLCPKEVESRMNAYQRKLNRQQPQKRRTPRYED